MEPASSWILVGFVTTEPRRELLSFGLNLKDGFFLDGSSSPIFPEVDSLPEGYI